MRPLLNTKNKFLNEIIKKSHSATVLTKNLQQYFDTDLAEHCTVVSLQRGCLTISVDSAAWATQFRYAQADLLKKLRTEEKMYSLRSIKCIVTPPSVALTPTNLGKQQLPECSAQNIKIIRNAAKRVKNNAIKLALEELAENNSSR